MYRDRFPSRSFRNLSLTAALVAATLAPWLYLVAHLGSAANTQPVLIRPSTIDLFNSFSQFMFGFQSNPVNSVILSAWPLVVLLIFMSLRRDREASPQTIYMFFSVAIPIVLAFTISYLWKPIYLTRYLVLTLPPLYLLVGWALSNFPARLGRKLKVIIIIAMLLSLSIEAVSAATPVKEDYRAAADYISSHATTQDVIVLSAPFTIYPFDYYYNGPVLVDTLPIWDQYTVGPIPQYSSAELDKDATTIEDSHQTLWLLLSYDQGYEENVRIYFDTHFQRIDHQNFSPGLDLYAYKLRYDSVPLSKALDQIKEGIASSAATPSFSTSTIPNASTSDQTSILSQ